MADQHSHPSTDTSCVASSKPINLSGPQFFSWSDTQYTMYCMLDIVLKVPLKSKKSYSTECWLLRSYGFPLRWFLGEPELSSTVLFC